LEKASTPRLGKKSRPRAQSLPFRLTSRQEWTTEAGGGQRGARS
jgi:hypothetical protein